MSTYTGLTKTQLLEVIEQRDTEVLDLLDKLDKESLQAKLNVVLTEAKLFGEDVLKLVQLVYELGIEAGVFVKEFIQNFKTEPPKVIESPINFPY